MDEFVRRLGIQFPIIQAPLGGGPGTPELTAAVSDAGAFGILGAAYLKTAELNEALKKIRSLTRKPFGVNLFIPSEIPKVTDDLFQKAVKATEAYRAELSLPAPAKNLSPFENFEKQMEQVLVAKPDLFSFTFGLLDPSIMRELKKTNIYTVGTATSLEEATILQDTGVDAVVVQGQEAGGHHGIFKTDTDKPANDIRSLTKACVRNLKIPVIAAGGLMNGKHVAELLALGAQAAQLGTAFMACPEAKTSRAHRKALLERKRPTNFTKAFSGRWARGLENKFMTEMNLKTDSLLPWPVQNAFTRDLRNRASELNNPEFLSLWAGENYPLIREMPAADLVHALVREML